MTSRYLSGLNQSIRDEMGVVHLFSLEDARQYALMAEKKVGRYGARRPLFRCVDGVTQRSPASVQGVRGQPTTSKTDRGATIAGQTGGRSDGIEKGKAIAKYGSQNAPSTSFSRTGNNSQIRSFSCGEKGHTSYQCPQKWVNLAEVGNEEEEFIEPLYDEYDDEADDIDVLPIKGESLVVRRVMTTPKVQEEDWRRRNIFRTRVFCGGKVCNVILDGGSSENIVSKEVVEKLKIPIEKHHHPCKVAWFCRGNEVPVTACCLVKFTMGNNVEDEAWCDVVAMDACHILLGRPWL